MKYTVYILSNATGETLYVGISWNWESRRLDHKRKSWFTEVSDVELIEVPDKQTALAMEWTLIYSRLPIFNGTHRSLPLPWTGEGPAPRYDAPRYRDPRPRPPRKGNGPYLNRPPAASVPDSSGQPAERPHTASSVSRQRL